MKKLARFMTCFLCVMKVSCVIDDPNIIQFRCTTKHLKREHLLDYKNVTHLSLRDCGLEYINSDAFNGLHRLYFLDVAYNDLRDIHPKTFHNVPHIKRLILDGNPIQLKHNRPLVSSNSIKRLDINHCNFNPNAYSKTTFSTLVVVKYISAIENPICHLLKVAHSPCDDTNMKSANSSEVTTLLSSAVGRSETVITPLVGRPNSTVVYKDDKNTIMSGMIGIALVGFIAVVCFIGGFNLVQWSQILYDAGPDLNPVRNARAG